MAVVRVSMMVVVVVRRCGTEPDCSGGRDSRPEHGGCDSVLLLCRLDFGRPAA